MATSLSNLADNLSEINNKNCKKCMERNKIKSECRYIKQKENKLIYKCKKCDDISYKSVNGFIQNFPSIYEFCNKNLNKFVLLIRKGVDPCEYMDSSERFNERSLSDKEYFYSELDLECITDEDYVHAQKVWDLYVQTDTLLLTDVF